jgi:hypothetical protein
MPWAMVARLGRGLFCAALALSGCAGTSVSVEPDGQELAASVTAVVVLPVELGYGTEADQRRIQRRAGDSLIALTGGHAVLCEELPRAPGRDLDDAQIAEGVRAAGEDPERTIGFAIVASRSHRTVANATPLSGFQMGRRVVADYAVRLEVRRAGHVEVIGTVNTVAAAEPNENEIGPRGESLGVQKAIDEAMARAIRTFAPGLATRPPGRIEPVIVEVPLADAPVPLARLKAVQELYPELSIDQIETLTASHERYLVIQPGTLGALGIVAGDLFDAPSGTTLTSRAALARTLARGGAVRLVVRRAGQRYLLADRR